MPVLVPSEGKHPFSAYLWGIETKRGKKFEKGGDGFQPTYEELKRCVAQNGRLEHFPVFSLPMRNWNAITIPAYEVTSTVFSLPMRNWNARPVVRISETYHVFSLPMRNWNQFIVSYHLPNNIRFQPTYEELKLQRPKNMASGGKGFQPTYEELKRESRGAGAGLWPPFSAYLWGIETKV